MKLMKLVMLSGVMCASASYAMLPTPDGMNTTQFGVMPTADTQATAPQVDSVVNVFVVQTDAVTGAETLVPVSAGVAVKSGDILEYQGLFSNKGENRIRSMDVVLDIADGLELVGGVFPQHAQASVDSQKFLRMPIRASINGVVQDLPLSRYKALKWTVEEIGLNGTAVVKYRAKVK